jgi:hypothetical protein
VLGVTKLLGALVLVAAAAAAALGIAWVYVDAVGTEWDYCRRGNDCIAGWKMEAGFIVVAAVVGVIGFSLLRRQRR